MPHRVQTNRSSTKNQRPAAGTREPGELYVNLADLQLGVTNATKNPQDLIAVRFFSSATDYAVGSFVIYSGVGYRAKEAITAGAFNATQWDTINVTGSAEPPIVAGTTSQYWRGDKSWQLLDKAAVGLSNVDNTSDANKPVSSAQQTALNLKANLASPTFTGDPKAPTPSYPDSDTSVATTAFVSNNFATILSPTFGGDPRAPTQSPGDSDTSIATTAFVQGELADYAPINSPVFVGDPRAPTPVPGDNDTSLATTAFVQTAVTGKITDAPSDGLTYGRKNANWATVIGGASMLDGPPDPPLQNGQLWVETDSGNTFAYYVDPSGTPGQWVQLSGSLAVPLPPSIDGALISDSVPVSAQPGQMWWQSSTGRLFVYFNDGTSSQWIQISGPLKPEFISSSAQDMWAGFKTGALFAINDKADGTGANVFSVSDTGAINATSLGATGAIAGANLTASGTLYASGGTMYVNQAAGYYNFAWTSSFVWRIIAASGRCELITNNAQRCYWDYSNGAFVNNGPAYKPGGGPFLDSSDERIKNVLGGYEPGLDEVVQLRPVRYTFKGNDTSEAPQGARITREVDDSDAPEYEEAGAAPYHNSTHYGAAVNEQQFIGLIAQEVEAVFPGMVTPRAGWIDGAEVDDLRDLDTTPLIFALINAVKTLAARVEALEGGAR